MTRITTEIKIKTPVEQVWEVLRDFGGGYVWNPGVRYSYTTNDLNAGEGAMRYCDMRKPGDYIIERAFDWREGEGYKIEIVETNAPIERMIGEFALRPDGDGTIVTFSNEYKLKFGVLGALMDVLMARRQFRKTMEEILAGLKFHVETGKLVDDHIPALALA